MGGGEGCGIKNPEKKKIICTQKIVNRKIKLEKKWFVLK